MMDAPRTHYSLRSFFSYISGYKLRFAVVLFWFMVANFCLAIIPLFIGKLVGALTTMPVDRHQVFVYVTALIACSSGHDITWHISEFFYMKLVKPVGFLYENIVFSQVIKKPYPYFVNKFTGKVASYVDTLGQELRLFIENICYNYTGQIVRLATVTIVLTSVNIYTGLIFMGNIGLMFLIGKYTIQNSARYEKKFADVQSTKIGKIVDTISNFVNVKSFQKEKEEINAIKDEQTKVIDASNKAFFWNAMFWGSMGIFVRHIMWPATILLNVYLFLDQQISIAELTTLLSTIVMFSEFVWEIIWNISQFNIKNARIEEAHTYLFGNTNIVAQQKTTVKPQTGNYELRHELCVGNLSFAYPDKSETEVLSGITLKLHKGEKLGVVGKSGSGKTTITKLLLGYYSVPEGELQIDGENIASKDLAELISYVPQDTSLFHRSIADNIAYATTRKVSRQEIIEAAKQAHADEFISQISDKYDALVGERGVKLSTGQRQRIAIARAFLDNKPILILDEATSALDSESEILVQEALEALWQNKTVIAIAHRLSTLRHMDRIIVLDKGQILEQGTHEELLNKKGKYSELWAHQSGGFLEE